MSGSERGRGVKLNVHESAAVLRAMAEQGIRVDDRAFERCVLAVLAELDRLRGIETRLRHELGDCGCDDCIGLRAILDDEP